jgi:peptidoglycan/LPS O-acetylase OafA/YrhL
MKDRLGVLDGLRGIAVLLVLWYHVWEISWQPAPWPWLEFVPETGFIGVHLFFFLSGFVIAYPFLRAQALGLRQPTWLHFAWRRFVKIVPSYALSIVVAYALGYAATQRWGDTPVWQEVLTHALFIHTWWPQTFGAINGVLWTLAVEVEFYLLFPLTWFFFKREPIVTGLLMIAIAALWRSWWAHCCFGGLYPWISENLPGYFDIFACGMLSALLFVRTGHRVRASRARLFMPLVATGGVALLVVLLLHTYHLRHTPQWEIASQIYTRSLFGLSFAAIAVASLCSPNLWQALLANRPLRFLAIVSYNLYLYHQLIARELLAWRVPPYAGDPHYDPAWQLGYTIVAFVVTIVQAALVTYFVERPLLRMRDPRLVAASSGHPASM